MKLVKTQEEAMLENDIKRSFSTVKRGTSTEGWWGQYRKLHPPGRSKLLHVFSRRMKEGRQLVREWLFSKCKSLVWGKSSPWRLNHFLGCQKASKGAVTWGDSLQGVLGSEWRQESTWMLLRPSKFVSVGDSTGELSQGWYLNCLGMLQFPAFWLK